MLRLPKQLWFAVVTLALVAGFFAPSARAADQRVVASLEEPFEINGELFPGGELALREFRPFSPVTTMAEVWVSGRCVGMLLAREEASATANRADEMIFQRGSDGHLVLVGLSLRGSATLRFLSFEANEPGRRWVSPSEQGTILAANR